MSANSVKALGWSALLHLLVIMVLWYTQQPVPAPVAQPKAIQAFVYQPIPRPAKPPIENSPEVLPEAASKTAPEPVPQSIVASPKQTAPTSKLKAPPKVSAEAPSVAPQTTANTTAPSDNISQTTDATHTTKPIQHTGTPMSLAERSLAIANRRHADVSSAALAAIQQRPDLRDRPATTSKTKLAPDHAAANVLMQLSDGSFIEKVGDYCYQAKPGADLLADIFSMKPVRCGEDKNAAMYERIMSKVGQDR